jgi:endonuclease/exonuclease/phosphatase family metal-dependent hydrolase
MAAIIPRRPPGDQLESPYRYSQVPTMEPWTSMKTQRLSFVERNTQFRTYGRVMLASSRRRPMRVIQPAARCALGVVRGIQRRSIGRLVVGCALVVTLTGGGGASGSSMAPGGSTYALLQMNLCLSGFADCYGRVAYPAGVHEAVARIRGAHPDAVTLNETCRRDVAQIARRSGYHLRFSTVTVAGEPLACVRPGGRGHFGDAVLTRAAITRADSHDFRAQAGLEWRRWLCVSTRAGIDVCTAHLATRSAANDAQCAELITLLERRAATRTVVFGGDVNRRRGCAPQQGWTQTDSAGQQAPGLQAVYGTGVLRSPSTRVLPAAHTDHDVLLVTAPWSPPPRAR